MIQRFDGCGRRFLNFPAVNPCEGISPATLLESLITMSRNICLYKLKFFATQRKNARETLRQIWILLIFFEEIADCRPNLPNSIILCFSELHLALQKILFLLEDCTRGSRLLLLMKSLFVATQFRASIRSIATALDVLPLSSIDISSEIKELVELVAKQARKVKLDIDPDDETAMERVILILNQFENKFELDRSFIKTILDYIEIKTWSDCHNEIKLLEEEIGLESIDESSRELPLLSSLVGFICYCRGVIFETGDYGNFDQTDGRHSIETVSCLNPEDFRCPISLELMSDPVTVSTGQTYDRVSIKKWLKAGNLICPVSGKKLANTELVPNSTLRKLIIQFCADNGICLEKSKKNNRDITRTILAGSTSAAESIKFLSNFLSSVLCFGTDEGKKKAAYEIRLLAKSNIFNRSCLIESGVVPPLLYLLNSRDPLIQENAIAALLKLSKHSNGKRVIVENGGLDLILSVLKHGLKLESQQIAAATVFYLSSINEYRKSIGKSRELFPALAKLLNEGTNFGKKNAVVAIFGLLLHKPNYQRVLSAGIVPLLIEILASSNGEELISDSLAVLSMLAESKEGSIAIQKTYPLPVLIKILRSSSSRAAKEYCVSILLALCNNCGASVVAELAKDSSLMGLLYLILTDGTSHARKKSRSLIRALHEYSETSSSSGSRSNAVFQEPFIHVR